MSTTVSSQAVPIGVGIDTARYGHHATFLRQDLQPATAPLEFTETRVGYNRLLKKLQQLERRFPTAHFHFRIDAASQYATNLDNFLRDLPLSKTISVGEPARNRSYRKAHFPKRKADVTDSYCQARYAIVERPKDTLGVPREFYALPASAPITSIPGIGDATAAVLTAKIISIDRFRSAGQLVAYFGVFPEEHTSGVDKFGKPLPPGTMHMSRQGNDLVRKYLWNAAMSAMQYNPAARALYNRLLARGTRPSVALGHLMRKLLHLVFAIWKTGKPFDPQHYPWEKPDAKEPVAGRNQGTSPAPTAVTATETSNVNQAACSVNQPTAPRTPRTQTHSAAAHVSELSTPANPHVPPLEENCRETARPAPSGRPKSSKRKEQTGVIAPDAY